MLAENCDLRAAIDLLQRRYVFEDMRDAPRRVLRPEPLSRTVSVVSSETRRVLNVAVSHYQQVLSTHPAMLDYLNAPGRGGRGLKDQTIERLKIGYSDGLTLARALHTADVNLGLAAQIGLLSPHGEMMRSRIVFPVLDEADPVFMIGRAVQRDQEPKYLGLPDGLAHKQPMRCGRSDRTAIVVEGPMDYAALVQWGLDAEFQLMALLGTGRTRAMGHFMALSPKPRVLLALDQDQPGQDATRRFMSELAGCGVHATILTWHGAKDCGELLQQGERGKAAFEQALAQAGA
jgi:DNA primase